MGAFALLSSLQLLCFGVMAEMLSRTNNDSTYVTRKVHLVEQNPANQSDTGQKLPPRVETFAAGIADVPLPTTQGEEHSVRVSTALKSLTCRRKFDHEASFGCRHANREACGQDAQHEIWIRRFLNRGAMTADSLGRKSQENWASKWSRPSRRAALRPCGWGGRLRIRSRFPGFA